MGVFGRIYQALEQLTMIEFSPWLKLMATILVAGSALKLHVSSMPKHQEVECSEPIFCFIEWFALRRILNYSQ